MRAASRMISQSLLLPMTTETSGEVGIVGGRICRRVGKGEIAKFETWKGENLKIRSSKFEVSRAFSPLGFDTPRSQRTSVNFLICSELDLREIT